MNLTKVRMKKFNFFLNQYLTKYFYHHKKIKLRNRPRIWDIELTNFCDLNCIMCARKFMKREIGFMDFSLFKRIIDQCKDYTDSIWLHLFGESLYHPQLYQFINYCSENGIKAKISTNATILDTEKALMLLKSRLDAIILCLDGVTEETYLKTRIGGDFIKVRENIINFLELKKELNRINPHAIVQIIRMDNTKDELDVFKKQWEGLADEVWIKDFCAWARQEEEIVAMAEKQRQADLLCEKKRHPCIYLWRDAVILWNGDVVPCCMDFDGKLVFGNLRRERLKDIWNSPKIKSLRKEQIENNYANPLCKNCSEWLDSDKDTFVPLSAIIRR